MSTAQMFNAMAAALSTISAAQYPDTVTFSRSTQTKGSAGGNITPTPINNSPTDIPCRYRPASGSEVELSGKTVAGAAYMIMVPARFGSSLVDVDAKSKATIAARTDGEPARVLSISWIGRELGIEIKVLASLTE